MPEPILGPRDTAVKETDKNPCPREAYSPVVLPPMYFAHCALCNGCLCYLPLPVTISHFFPL